MSAKIANFDIEGEAYRVRGLERDSGVSTAARTGFRKWLLERRGAGSWVQEGYVVLPNSAGASAAKERWT